MQTSFFDTACDYVEKYGFSVIPLRKDKRPYIKWDIYQSRKPTEEEIEDWERLYPDANIGIVTGRVSNLIVVDADSAKGVELLKKKFPVTSVYIHTAKGMHAYYRHPGERVQNGVRIMEDIDIRGDGGYVVAAPSEHESGVVYTPEFTPGLDGYNELALFKMPGHSGEIDLSDIANEKPIEYINIPEGERNSMMARIAGERAGKGESLNDITMYLLGCNATCEKPLSKKEVETIAKSIYNTHQKNHPSEKPVQEKVVAIDIKKEEKRLPKGLSDTLMHPGGLMEDFMNYVEKSSPIYDPVYALGASIALIGSVAGLRFETETGLKPNVYVFNVGGSGTGKDAPQKAISNILRISHAYKVMGANELSSTAALISSIENTENHTLLDVYDEIGLLLEAFKDPNGYRKEMLSAFMQFFTKTGTPFSKRYAEKEKNISIPYHCYSFIGSTTPLRLWENLTHSEATDGFLARCLMFVSNSELQLPKEEIDDEIPQALINKINAIYAMPLQKAFHGNGNMPEAEKIISMKVRKDDEAKKYFRDWEVNKVFPLRKKYASVDETLSSIYGRFAELAHKVALDHCLSNFPIDMPFNPEVSLEDVKWAIELVEWCGSNLINGIRSNIADSKFEKQILQVKDVIRRHVEKAIDGRPGATMATINNRCRAMTLPELDQVIKKLKATGELTPVMWKQKDSKKNPLEYLVLSEIKDDLC